MKAVNVLCSCKARLGSYNWAGSQSESGAWVTPAFQLHHSKVDAMSAQAVVPMNIRRPLVGPSMSRSVSSGAQQAPTPAAQMAAVQGEQSQASSLHEDLSVVPVDAARTVSDAGHAAAEIAAGLERPAVVPRNDSTHPHLNDSQWK